MREGGEVSSSGPLSDSTARLGPTQRIETPSERTDRCSSFGSCPHGSVVMEAVMGMVSWDEGDDGCQWAG